MPLICGILNNYFPVKKISQKGRYCPLLGNSEVNLQKINNNKPLALLDELNDIFCSICCDGNSKSTFFCTTEIQFWEFTTLPISSCKEVFTTFSCSNVLFSVCIEQY